MEEALLTLLPLATFAMLVLNSAASCGSYRIGFLAAALCWGAMLTLFTEVLSAFSGITVLSLSLAWGGTLAIASGYFIARKLYRNLPEVSVKPGPAAWLGIAAIMILTFVTGIIAPPNTWDSMTYHMGRVVHWIQNQSVRHYPTNIPRQLYFPPWAEFAIMHLQVLGRGSDRFANLVQWFAMCGSLVGVSLIARQLGGSRLQQLLAAVIAATIPMGILQSSSTQNDYVVAFWLVAFVFFGMRNLAQWRIANLVAAGTALGLAILTKGTAYVYAFPFVLWFLAASLRPLHRLLSGMIVVASIVLALNIGHYVRNTALWGSPLAADFDQTQTSRRDLPALMSNLSRNMVSNTWSTSLGCNLWQHGLVARLHDILGIELSDSATSLRAEFTPGTLSLHEDLAGNGLHTVLILITLPFVPVIWHRNRPSPLIPYCLTILGVIVLFSMLVKWQPWITRLQLPGFVLCSALVACAVPIDRHPIFGNGLMVLMLAAATPWLLYNQSRPLLGDWTIFQADRQAMYFVNNPELLDYYDQAANLVAARTACRDIGLHGDLDAYEYPLWALIRSRRLPMPRLEHINVENDSGKIPRPDFTPCMQVKLLQTL
jgi:4-amino-4-deoxy-L-arabinose transferase-like glycosyltransferase